MANHLTDEQKAKAKPYIQKLKGCLACGAGVEKLSLEDMVVVPRYWGGVIRAGADSVPMLQVICGECFHILHFAPVPMGIT